MFLIHFLSLWQLSQFEDAKLSWDVSFGRHMVFGVLGVFLGFFVVILKCQRELLKI